MTETRRLEATRALFDAGLGSDGQVRCRGDASETSHRHKSTVDPSSRLGEIHFVPRDYFLRVKGDNLRGVEAKKRKKESVWD